jgi:[acyl-carrier-protein] S-malonyltransferase
MVAVIGIGADVLEAVCEEATTDDEFVAIANHNSPEQLVLSGHLAALRRAGEMAQAAGAKRVIPLRVSSAFHSPLMENVEEEMQRLMQEETFSDPQVRFYANVSGRLAEDAATVRALLARQVTSPVRWTEALRRMSDDGVRHFVEVGPGKVLVGLVRRTVPGARLYTTDTEAALMEVVGVLAGR